MQSLLEFEAQPASRKPKARKGPKPSTEIAAPILTMKNAKQQKAVLLEILKDDHCKVVLMNELQPITKAFEIKTASDNEQDSNFAGTGLALIEAVPSLTKVERQKIVNVLENVSDNLGVKLTDSIYTIEKSQKAKVKTLIQNSGLQWERIMVPEKGRVSLVTYFDLKVFLPWLLSHKSWCSLYPIPKSTLAIAYDPDGFPSYRWAKDKKNGFFNITIKLLHNQHLVNSVHGAIPVLSYHGSEEYCYLEPLVSGFLHQFNDFSFKLGDRHIDVVFLNVGDMSARWKIFQIGGSPVWPLLTLPLHTNQLGDISLNPSGLVSRWDEQKGFRSTSKSNNSDCNFGLTGRKNLAGCDPCKEVGGVGHMHKNLWLRFAKMLLFIAESNNTLPVVSRRLFGKVLTVEQFDKDTPQWTGLDCRESSRQFTALVAGIGGSRALRNALLSFQFELEKLTWLLFESNQTNETDYWWSARIFHILFVSLFGKHNVVPSIAELVFCLPFVLQNLEELSKKVGIDIKIKNLVEWVMEQRNCNTNQTLKQTNHCTEPNSIQPSKNDPKDGANRVVQLV